MIGNPMLKLIAYGTALMVPTIIAVDLPVDIYTKIGATGALSCVSIWLISRTIPQMQESFAKTIEGLMGTFREEVRDIHSRHEEDKKEISSGFEKVETAIKNIGDQQIELLSKLIKE